MRLLLIRHGQTPSNVEGLLDTRIPGPGLTELGFEQAAAVPAALAGETVDAIYVSVQVRTHLTSAPLVDATGLVPAERAGIREIQSGDYEMLGDEKSVHGYMSTIFAWTQDPDTRMPGGESGTEVMDRYNAVIAEAYEAGYGTVAMFSHGAVIRAWVGHNALNVGPDFVRDNSLGNTGIVVLEGSPETGWTAISWMGAAVGGPSVDDVAHAGPTGESA